MIDELTERRLTEALRDAVATLPPDPPTSWADARSRRPEPHYEALEPPRRGRGRRIGLAIAVVGGLVGGGTGIAAAVGAFSATPKEVWGAAYNLTLTANWSQPTEVARVVAPGPHGTTLLVGSSSVPQGTCEALAVSTPGTKSTIVGSVCQGSIHTATTPQLRRTYGMSTAGWTSPTGTQYALSYGQAPSGMMSVAFVSSSGTHLVTGTTSDGWYVIAVPTADVAHGNVVTFYGPTGASLGTRPATGAFATPTAPTGNGNVPSRNTAKGSQGVAPMYAVGYAGIKFTRTGQASFLLQDGKSVTVPAHVAIKMLQIRAKTGTPPLPATGTVPPTVPAGSVILEGK